MRCRTASSGTISSTAPARAGGGRKAWTIRAPSRCATPGRRSRTRSSLAHGVDRIEALGNDAVVVGSDGRDLHFTSLRLGPRALGRRPLRARERERRAKRAATASSTSRRDGTARPADRRARKSADAAAAAANPPSVLFLRTSSLKLTEVGALDSRPGGNNDGCRASCVDWYGNSRPLFLKGRVLALMGYELVEGELRARPHPRSCAAWTSPRALAFLRH